MTSWAARRFAVIDTETTGLEFGTDRVIQLSVAIVDAGQYMTGSEWLINNGYPSKEDAIKVHGITDEEREQFGLDPQRVFFPVSILIEQLISMHCPLVAFNAAFDLLMLQHEFSLLDLSFKTEGLYVIDPLVIDRHYQKNIPVFTKPWMRLEKMAERYRVLAPSHHALDDAKTTGYVLIEQTMHHPPLRRMSLPELHRNQVKWHDEWANILRSWGTKKSISFTIPVWPFGSQNPANSSGARNSYLPGFPVR